MMALNEAMSGPVRELIERVTEEVDTEQLRELILAINMLLDAIQNQRVKLEGDTPRTH
jgi:predicted oxidoreductase